jgi:hypothetical protein
VNTVGTGRVASAARRAGRPERNGPSETAGRNQRHQGDATARTAASATAGRTGRNEALGSRSWNRHLGVGSSGAGIHVTSVAGGSSTSRKPARSTDHHLSPDGERPSGLESAGGVAGRRGLRAESERGTPDGVAFGPNQKGDPRKRTGLRTRVDRGGSRGRELEPHGREWLKQVTGSGGDQTVKVAKNDEDGPRGRGTPRRGRKPSAAELFEA